MANIRKSGPGPKTKPSKSPRNPFKKEGQSIDRDFYIPSGLRSIDPDFYKKSDPKYDPGFKKRGFYVGEGKGTGLKTGGKVMLKRKDGSVSQKGLWDNIRTAAKRNKAAGKPGKRPTAAMLKQERKIKSQSKKKK